jgi:hypothetical protein
MITTSTVLYKPNKCFNISVIYRQATGSSHVGSESINDSNATNGHNEENRNGAIRVALETLNCHSGNHG